MRRIYVLACMRRARLILSYPYDAFSQCCIDDGSTNPYLQEPRIVEGFLRDLVPSPEIIF
ncbi:hypothetical protein [Rhizobium sp. PP-CC-3G-465]|uniref:hypothetical protein n=1 Tax=Rhizobium sp. PP-CC-3G-465 TaxID=2135648 RepID=UPI0014052364